MPRHPSQYPTELELEILKILWRDGVSPVRHVRDELAVQRDLAYTSVMTTMNIMTDKGYLRRTRKKGGYVYKPCITRESTASRMMGDVVNRVFAGSAVAAMLHLVETGDIDETELAALRALLDKKGDRT